MLCPPSASKPSSSWLDRLRISKGFAVPSDLDPDLDLDHFLSSHSEPNPNPDPDPNANTSPIPEKKKKKKENDAVVDLVASALADLFVMGGHRDAPKRPAKASRKQPAPRACAGAHSAPPSADASCRGAPSPPSADNSVSEMKKARAKPPRRKRRSKGPAGSDLAAYSRTEVTVIDTSSPGWKSEKIIFRRGAVWKVRDKKVWCAWRKKRKLGLVEKLVGEKGKEKPLAGVEVLGRKEQSVSVDEECTHDDKRDASKETLDQIRLPRRRPKFSRSPRVPAAKDSSVYHLQVITSSSKYGTSCSKGKLKGK